MQLMAETREQGVLLRLEGELTIYTAAALKSQLAPYLAGPQRVEMDLAGVSELDSAGLQLLLLAKRELDRQGGALALLWHSQAVLEVLELCRLNTHFGDPQWLPAGPAA
ncbi:STAS domain-containing protein [Zobellella iuensis]|uniref:Anti-sigma factor antagonist n=1 Tax=Zobellella iuensis TaxID=2803811 RepID=A0ABS1QNS2_9GAMM|nr:STAS domain-containing protein [Zobellella iuensis]MBL1376508.1 STAS domain-containing protein [Zobellella iuensis]